MMEAIKLFHGEVSEDLLLKEKEFAGLRSRLLKGAAGFYGKLERLLEGQDGPLASRADLGRAYFELGELTAQIGNQCRRPGGRLSQGPGGAPALAGRPSADAEAVARRRLCSLNAIAASLRLSPPRSGPGELAPTGRPFGWPEGLVASGRGERRPDSRATSDPWTLKRIWRRGRRSQAILASWWPETHQTRDIESAKVRYTIGTTSCRPEWAARPTRSRSTRRPSRSTGNWPTASPTCTRFQNVLATIHNNIGRGDVPAGAARRRDVGGGPAVLGHLPWRPRPTPPLRTLQNIPGLRPHITSPVALTETGRPAECLDAAG